MGALLATAAFVAPASGQETTTQAPTTVAPVTQAPTTAAPVTQAPTTQAPVTQAPVTQAPTTQAPVTAAPTTAAATASSTIPQVDLPGEQITAGSLNIVARFHEQSAANCEIGGQIGGQQMNMVLDEKGNIGAIYGKGSVGSSQVGMVMVELGPLPMAVGALRSTGACDIDVVGIGAFSSTPKSADLSSVGYSMYPKGDYLDQLKISATVGASAAPAKLSLQEAYDFLIAKRPGQA
jgi:hypothetical protein